MDLATLKITVEAKDAAAQTRNLDTALKSTAVSAEVLEKRAASLARMNARMAAGANQQAMAVKAQTAQVAAAAASTQTFTVAQAAAATQSTRTAAAIATSATTIATGFGPAGLVAMAVTGFATTFVSNMIRAKTSAKDFVDDYEKQMNRLVNAGDVAELSKMAQDVYKGTPAAKFLDGIEEAQRKVDALKARNANVFGALGDIFGTEKLEDAEKALKKLTDRFAELQKRIMDTKNVPFGRSGLPPVIIGADAPDKNARKTFIQQFEEEERRAAARAQWEYDIRKLRRDTALQEKADLLGITVEQVKVREEMERTGKVLLENARLARNYRLELPTITGIQNGVRTSYKPGEGYMGGVPAGRDLMTNRKGYVSEQELAARQIAENFTENMQRATADIFADFLRTGSLSVRNIFSSVGNIGADLFGQAISKALMPKFDSMGTGAQLGIGLGIGLLGSAITSMVDSSRRFNEEMRQAAKRMSGLNLSLTDWIKSSEMWDASPDERARYEISQRAAGYRRNAWEIYEGAPGDFMKGLTGDAAKDQELIRSRLAGAGGKWDRLVDQGQDTPARALRAYYEALQQVTKGVEAATEATREQAEAEKRLAAIDRIAGYSRTIEGLQGFRSSLTMSSLSTANPFEKLNLARSQYDRLFASAMGGDQAAAGRLPDAARVFLENSRGVNASGGRYNVDFTKVNADTDRVMAMFGDLKSAEEILLGVAQETADHTNEHVEIARRQERRDEDNEAQRRKEHNDEIAHMDENHRAEIAVMEDTATQTLALLSATLTELRLVARHTRDTSEAIAP